MQKFSNLLPIPINKSLQATTNPFISCELEEGNHQILNIYEKI